METEQTVKHRSYMARCYEPHDGMGEPTDIFTLQSKDKYEHILKKLSETFGDNFDFMAFQIKHYYPTYLYNRFINENEGNRSKQYDEYYNTPEYYIHDMYFSFREAVDYSVVKNLFYYDILRGKQYPSLNSLIEEDGEEERREVTFGCNRKKHIDEVYFAVYNSKSNEPYKETTFCSVQ